MKLTGAQIVCEGLIKEGVDVVFGILGGQILPLYDTLTQYPQIRHILTGTSRAPPMRPRDMPATGKGRRVFGYIRAWRYQSGYRNCRCVS
jgi:hypothetical protein